MKFKFIIFSVLLVNSSCRTTNKKMEISRPVQSQEIAELLPEEQAETLTFDNLETLDAIITIETEESTEAETSNIEEEVIASESKTTEEEPSSEETKKPKPKEKDTNWGAIGAGVGIGATFAAIAVGFVSRGKVFKKSPETPTKKIQKTETAMERLQNRDRTEIPDSKIDRESATFGSPEFKRIKPEPNKIDTQWTATKKTKIIEEQEFSVIEMKAGEGEESFIIPLHKVTIGDKVILKNPEEILDILHGKTAFQEALIELKTPTTKKDFFPTETGHSILVRMPSDQSLFGSANRLENSYIYDKDFQITFDSNKNMFITKIK